MFFYNLLKQSLSNYRNQEKFILKYTRLNNDIRANRLRVIDESGHQLGVLSKEEALKLAIERSLDLVEISPDANPPVAKIVDWGKYNYQKTKSIQKNKKNSKILDVKQMRLGLKISDNDLMIKLKKIDKFLDIGHKVKVTLVYKGREQAHKEIGYQLADKIIEYFDNRIAIDQKPILLGKQLNFMIRRNNVNKELKNAETKNSQRNKKPS